MGVFGWGFLIVVVIVDEDDDDDDNTGRSGLQDSISKAAGGVGKLVVQDSMATNEDDAGELELQHFAAQTADDTGNLAIQDSAATTENDVGKLAMQVAALADFMGKSAFQGSMAQNADGDDDDDDDDTGKPALQSSTAKTADETEKSKTPKQAERRRLRQQKKRQTNRQKKRDNHQQQQPQESNTKSVVAKSPSEDGPEVDSNGQNFEVLDLPLKFTSDVNFEIEGWPAVTIKHMEVEMVDDNLSICDDNAISTDARKELFITIFRNAVISDLVLDKMFTLLQLRHPKTRHIDRTRKALFGLQDQYNTLLEEYVNAKEQNNFYHGWFKDKWIENNMLKKQLEAYQNMLSDVEGTLRGLV